MNDAPAVKPATPFPVTVDAAAQDVPCDVRAGRGADLGAHAHARSLVAAGEGKTLTLSPDSGELGWWRNNDPRRNYRRFVSTPDSGTATPTSPPCSTRATPRRTHHRRDAEPDGSAPGSDCHRRQHVVAGNWCLESSLEQLPDADFPTLYSAPASIVLYPQLRASDPGRGPHQHVDA
ncbi:MAG: hypothetical protein R3A10_16620 [Caldilineaceae bacterium]